MNFAEIGLDGIIYILLGLVWLVLQIAGAAGRGRKRRESEQASPAGAPAPRPAPAAEDGPPPRRYQPPSEPEVFREFMEGLLGERLQPAAQPRPRRDHHRPSPPPPPPPAAVPVAAPAALPESAAAPSADQPSMHPSARFFDMGGSTIVGMPAMPGLSFRSAPSRQPKAAYAGLFRASGRDLRQAYLAKVLLDPPRALTPPGGGSWWDPRRG